jgi:hypothetical protein
VRNNQKVLIVAAIAAAVVGFGIVALVFRAREAERPARAVDPGGVIASPTQPAATPPPKR